MRRFKSVPEHVISMACAVQTDAHAPVQRKFRSLAGLDVLSTSGRLMQELAACL